MTQDWPLGPSRGVDLPAGPPDADERSIRAAFRRLAKQYHPDKVHHLGEDYQRVAHEKFLALKAAYEEITSRG